MVDECTGPAVARWLSDERGHEVFSVYDEARGAKGDDLIDEAFSEGWMLVTNDRDFGEKVFREQRPHRGIVFLRLGNERNANKIEVLSRLLDGLAGRLVDRFVVVTETQVRFSGGTLGGQNGDEVV